MLEYLVATIKALEVLKVPQRLKDLENKSGQFFKSRGVRSVNDTQPDDKGNVTISTFDQTAGDARYVLKTGDTMTGDLEFDEAVDGVIFKSGSSSSITAGMPIGLLLALTYSGSVGSALKRWKVSVDTNGALTTTEL